MSRTTWQAQKRYRLRKLRGESAFVDATQARLHLASLKGYGWSLRGIAGTCGVPASTLSLIVRDDGKRVRPATAAAILAVPVHGLALVSDTAAEPFVPRVGTVRRIQALLFMGWTHEEMLNRSGVRTSVTVNQQGRWVTRSTHDAVASLYRELSHMVGPSSRTRLRAQRLGYAGPLDWDDIDHDLEPDRSDEHDVCHDIDPVVVMRLLEGSRIKATRAEREAALAQWIADGGSERELCEWHGWREGRYSQANRLRLVGGDEDVAS